MAYSSGVKRGLSEFGAVALRSLFGRITHGPRTLCVYIYIYIYTYTLTDTHDIRMERNSIYTYAYV